jgi:hypothetical protein
VSARTSINGLKVVTTVPIQPHAGKVTDALSRIGYKIEEAIADLVDNSIDASATNILIRFVHDGSEIKRIVLADDGLGMSNEELLSAMQFGSTRERSPQALGKFGMGLKTAALSQGRSLTVISKQAEQVVSCRWTTKSIAAGWNCELLDSEGAAMWMAEIQWPFAIGGSGTLVIIDELDHALIQSKSLEVVLQRLQKKLSVHLGLVFHRFIDAGVKLYIDASNMLDGGQGFVVTVGSLNPFSYPITGEKNYPLQVSLHVTELQTINCIAHIWPPNQISSGYLLGGTNVATRQGFYFYRNGRLIQAGGWNGWRENNADHHLSLARVEVELSQEFDAEFRLNVQKSALDVPDYFRMALVSKDGAMDQYLRCAEDVYRKTVDVDRVFIPVPGRGFGVAVRRKASTYLAGQKSPRTEVNIVWAKLPEDRFFRIDRSACNVVLNAMYRQVLLKGTSASLNDAPTIKILLFLLLRDDLLRERESKRFTARLEEINELLMLAVNEENSRMTE